MTTPETTPGVTDTPMTVDVLSPAREAWRVFRRNKAAMLGLGLLILIFSVAGIPPAAGFWGKLQVFTAGIESGLLWLVLVGCLASVVSLGYYLRLVWAMFMKPAGEPLDKTDISVAATVAITTLLMFPVLTVVIQYLLDLAARAAGG